MTVWRLISLMTSLVGARVLGAGLGFLAQLILARLFSREDVGTVFLAMSASVFVSLVVTAGYPSLGVTTLARYQTLGRKSLVNGFLGRALKDTAFWTVLMVIAAALACWLVPLPPGLRTALLFGCATAVPYALMRLNNTAANSLRMFSLSYVPDFVVRPGLLLLFIGGCALFAPEFSKEHVLWAFLAITLLVTLVQAWAMRSRNALAGWGAPLRPRLAAAYRRQAGALVIVALVTLTFADTVTLLAGFFLPEADIAVLGVAIRLAALVGFVTQSSQLFVMRDLTAAMARGSRAEIDLLLMRTNALSLAAMAAALFAAVLFGDRVLAVFGQDYTQGHWPLVVFLVSQTLRAASGMNAHLLSLGGQQKRTAWMCLAAVLVLVAGIALLAPRYGVLGVAIATVLAEAVWALALGYLAQRLTGQRGDILAALKGSR